MRKWLAGLLACLLLVMPVYAAGPGDTTQPVPVQSEIVSVGISKFPTKINYTVGEAMDLTGLALQVSYTDGHSEIITSGYTTTGFDSSVITSSQIISVGYNDFTSNFTIRIVEKKVVNLQCEWLGSNNKFIEGYRVTKDDMAFYAVYNNWERLPISPDEVTLEFRGNPVIGSNQIEVTYQDQRTMVTYLWVENKVVSMQITPPTDNLFYVGEPFAVRDVSVIGTKADGSKHAITSECAFVKPIMTELGEQTVVVQYLDLKLSYPIVVRSLELDYMNIDRYDAEGIVELVFTDGEVVMIPSEDINVADAGTYKKYMALYRNKTFVRDVYLEDIVKPVRHSKISNDSQVRIQVPIAVTTVAGVKRVGDPQGFILHNACGQNIKYHVRKMHPTKDTLMTLTDFGEAITIPSMGEIEHKFGLSNMENVSIQYLFTVDLEVVE